MEHYYKICYYLYFDDIELCHYSERSTFDRVHNIILSSTIFPESHLIIKEFKMLGSRQNVSDEFIDFLEEKLTCASKERDAYECIKIKSVLNVFDKYRMRVFTRLPIEEQNKLTNEAEQNFRNRMIN